MTTAMARRLWMLLEPLHACGYYAQETADAFNAAGIRGGWRHYIASRAAPLGTASGGVVAAAFFNFEPAFITERVPTLWDTCTPDEAWRARVEGADGALRRLIAVESHAVARAADLAERAARACPPEGRVLFAAHLAMPWPESPHLRLWQAVTLLREFRGDGHSAALVAAGLTGLDAHITLAAAAGRSDRAVATERRGWSEAQWDERVAELRRRGLMEGVALTKLGRAVRSQVEDATDTAAAAPWEALSSSERSELAVLAEGLSRHIIEQRGLPLDNALGMPKWWDE